ncbi:DUF2474 domain-containing protein [Acinetobacter shaoyimingii]|uniref:DUF2474 domain-containing protein n=1 Tax=Acinetobacter shaoyimingii TaxID=2715164 RepID=A0A6G8RVT1_9GAMM|nr:DUF2474 domain-containing protein [Acinetobacter shaoyimingii]NHB57465.1 DUF2474 domain-containing protein [Acinetobacter shaoyimingii]QIO05940.1 DUF2474 domain-containing protein [Acinetobacter shaoyimingii]
MKLSQAQWFILLWLAGFMALAVIAGFFRWLIQIAY